MLYYSVNNYYFKLYITKNYKRRTIILVTPSLIHLIKLLLMIKVKKISNLLN